MDEPDGGINSFRCASVMIHLHVSPKNIMSQATPKASSELRWLSRSKKWIEVHKDAILVATIAGVLVVSFVSIVGLAAKIVYGAPSLLSALGQLLTEKVEIEVWGLMLCISFPFLVFLACIHLMRYRFNSGDFCGMNWQWAYSLLRGKVKKVKAFCPCCGKEYKFPSVWFQSDNYLCDCGYDSLKKQRDSLPHNWVEYIQSKVNEHRNG